METRDEIVNELKEALVSIKGYANSSFSEGGVEYFMQYVADALDAIVRLEERR